METKFIPNSDSLKNTDWKNPSFEKNNKKRRGGHFVG